MNKFLKGCSFIFCLTILLVSCSTNLNIGNKPSYDLSKVLMYKNSYVGDNSAVSNILNNLPANEYLNGIELKTQSEPYGIIANYKISNKKIDLIFEDKITKKLSQEDVLLYNAVIILALVQNANYIEYKFDNGEGIKYERSDLKQYQEKYGKNLESLVKDKNSLEKFLKQWNKW